MTFIRTIWVNNGKSRQTNYNEDTTQFGNAMYRVLHERSNITTSFTEHLSFKKNGLLHMHFGLIAANQNKKTTITTFHILKKLYIGCFTKETIENCFLCGAPEISRINYFYTYFLCFFVLFVRMKSFRLKNKTALIPSFILLLIQKQFSLSVL